MNNKNILIIIASYNNENTIEMAIESCLQQTYKNIKIAMIDDASKDNTYNIMKKYYNENKDKIFLFQNKKNIGKYLSDNKVLSNIKNNNLYKFDYWTSHGADDISDIRRIEILLNQMKRQNLKCLESTYQRRNLKTNKVINEYCGEGIAIYHKDVFEKLGYYDNTRYSGDTEYFWRLKQYITIHNFIWKIGRNYKILYIAYEHEHNLTKKFPVNEKERTVYFKKIQEEIIQLKDENTFYRNKKGNLENKNNKISENILIYATVAMPLFNMKEISTLTLESLCKQKTNYKWELLVCEELNDNCLSEKKLMEYKDKLKLAGCIRIKYIGIKKWIPLGQKWKLLSENASNTKCFILQAGDCYSHNLRIEETCNAFNKGYNYYDEEQGYFYSYRLNKTILFKPNLKYEHPCRLNMTWETNLIKKLPNNNIKQNVDTFLYRTLSKIKKLKKYRNTNLYENGVDIDGYNIITSRDEFFLKKNNIFMETSIDITKNLSILNKYKNLKLTKRFKD